MADNKIPTPENKIPTGEQPVAVENQQEKVLEKKEISQNDRAVSAELRREIEMRELEPGTKKDAEIEREKIEYLGEKEKIEHLLQIAKEKGLVFAIQIARKMNEPYLLDVLHDTLAKEGFYKDFMSKSNPVNDDDKKT